MELFSFKKGSKYLWLIVLSPVAYTLRDLAFKLLFGAEFTNHPMLISAIMFLGEILAGLPQFFIKVKSSNTEKKQNYRVYQNTLHSTKGEIVDKPEDYSITNKKVFLKVALSSVIDFLCYTATSYLCSYLVIELYNIHTEMRITPIFFMSLLSWKFLNIEIFLHHKVAILIVAIGYILISINRLISFIFDDSFKWYFLILFFIIHSVYSIKQINDKYIIEKYFMSPYILLFYQGIIGLLLCILTVGVFSIMHVINEKLFGKESLLNYFQKDSFSQLVDVFHLDAVNAYLLLLTVTGVFVNIIFMLIKQFFSPTHRSIADSLNAFATWAYLFTFPSTKSWVTSWDWKKLLDIFGYIVIIIGSLMYNELLIIHRANLDCDLIEKISKRGDLDTISASSMIAINPPEEEKDSDNVNVASGEEEII